MTIVEYELLTNKKSTGLESSEKRFYVGSLHTATPRQGAIVRNQWSIKSVQWARRQFFYMIRLNVSRQELYATSYYSKNCLFHIFRMGRPAQKEIR